MGQERQGQSTESRQSTDPVRIRTFATYFRNYMGISSIVTAALPIPVTLAKFIPIYSFQTKFFSVFTSLFCFLLLAYIFYRRHALAPLMFPYLRQRPNVRGSATVSNLPAYCILGCLISVVVYLLCLGISVNASRPGIATFNEFLQSADPSEVPIGFQLLLFVCYLGIFLWAMGAFVLMAIKEFLQDTLGITEHELLTSKGDTTPPEVTWTNPQNTVNAVQPDIQPTATFSKDMKHFTIQPATFKLFDVGASQEVRPLNVTYDEASRLATFTPDAPLKAGSIYEATITAGVQDQAGKTLAQDHTWYFRVLD
jgi:hypothetical protein